jgi:hypothetical protein
LGLEDAVLYHFNTSFRLLIRIWKASESHLTGILAFQMPFRYGSDTLEKPFQMLKKIDSHRKNLHFITIYIIDIKIY